MAILADIKNVRRQDTKTCDLKTAVDIIYKGALCSINADGYILPASDTASEIVVGVALETVDNSAGSAGDETCKIDTNTIIDCVIVGAAQSDVNSLVYVVDDQTVATANPGNTVVAGRIVEYISATKVRVLIKGFNI